MQDLTPEFTLDHLTKVTDPLGGQTAFGYDPNGNLLSVADARGKVTAYAPDVMDRVQTRTDPLGKTESYQYDQNGNLKQVIDRKGQPTTITWDALDRPTGLAYADGSTTTLTWDAGDRLRQVVDSLSGTITLTPDLLDRLQQEVTPQGTVSYAYDNADRRTSLTVLGQPAVTYTYDVADRLTSLTQGSATVTIAYDDADRRTSLTLPNGVIATSTYSTRDELASVTFKKGTTTLGTLTYTYDAAGRRISIGGTWARTGLPAAVASATYDDANRQLTWGAQTLTYDDNGNLTSDGTNTYTWDARDRLASLTGGVAATFAYDPFGRRTRKTISGQTTDYLYDWDNPVQELSGSTVLANLLTGLGIDEYFTRTDASGRRSLLGDALGSILALTDDAGVVQTAYTYEPFGQTTATGQGNGSPFQYTGRENDGTGLYYYRARYYSPTRQRFLGEDPIGFASGTSNLYAYVGNNPLGLVDPFGLKSIEFDRSNNRIIIRDKDGNEIMRAPAHNDTRKPEGDPNKEGSRGPAPNGTFRARAPVIYDPPRPEFGPAKMNMGSWGKNGKNPDKAAERGIAIHGYGKGRKFFSQTEGCIRVHNQTMQQIINEGKDKNDPITTITIY